MTKTRKKLIELALPLEAINTASAREKSIRHGHPSTLHLWWARRPLAAARAVIFAQMVDDPSSWPDLFPTEKKQDKERQRLFKIIEDLVLWENTTNEQVLQAARDEIWTSWRRSCAENIDHPRAKELFNRNVLPAFHDPFAGGGALPLEAQRLGLESYASDLNPVAVLINKAMIEIPPKFAGKPPVNIDWQKKNSNEKALADWSGACGLAEDVRYYGLWMRDEAQKRIGDLYPPVEVTAEMTKVRPDLKPYVGQKLTVIAWIWARTVKSPNPAFNKVDVPLASTFMLSTKQGKEAYVEPVIEGQSYRFEVKVGKPRNADAAKNGTKVGRGGNFQCLLSGTPIPVANIREQGLSGTLGSRLMAVVAEGPRGRLYLSPSLVQEKAASRAAPTWIPETEINHNPRDIRTQLYGLKKYGDLFTPRQLVALTTFSDLVTEAREIIKRDAIAAGMPDDKKPLASGGEGATAYAEAVGVYLGLGVSRSSSMWSSNCWWQATGEFIAQVFTRQAVPMVWDFGEVNVFSGATGNWSSAIEWITRVMDGFPSKPVGSVLQFDASKQNISSDKLISTDPPYYDNIGYADLSDFYYVWQRRTLRNIFADMYNTMAVPKAEELVATPYRHGNKENAEKFFLNGMTQAMHRLAEQAHPAYPVTIYYAFKQSESDGGEGTTNTGWDTFLAAVIEADFAITGTWPIRTERPGGVKAAVNALASSIVLVCRPRPHNAPTATRRDFLNALKEELPSALAHLQAGNIAPVDLAQAAIGPGMAIYTRFSKVIDAEGKKIQVRAALALINAEVEEFLNGQDHDFDADTRWAITWLEQVGFSEGEFGVATTLAQAKNTSVNGLEQAGIVLSGRGKVRLLKAEELTDLWDPNTDQRLTTWESVHRMIQAQATTGEAGAAAIVAKLGSKAETARELCYRLYSICERKKRASDAMAYNALVQSWPEIARLAQHSAQTASNAIDLFDQE
jgi:putative DNA methylase